MTAIHGLRTAGWIALAVITTATGGAWLATRTQRRAQRRARRHAAVQHALDHITTAQAERILTAIRHHRGEHRR